MKRILCFGDSNTYGHNPKDASRLSRRWTRCIAEILGSDYEIIEEGLCGRTTVFPVNGIIDGWEGSTLLKPVIATHKPYDLLIIMLGTNDLLLSTGADISDSARGLEELIKTARENFQSEILVISPILIDKSVKDNEIFCELYGPERACELSKQFAGSYKPIALKYGCHFMNAADFAQASALDGVHMDEKNHKQLAKAIAAKIKAIFE